MTILVTEMKGGVLTAHYPLWLGGVFLLAGIGVLAWGLAWRRARKRRAVVLSGLQKFRVWLPLIIGPVLMVTAANSRFYELRVGPEGVAVRSFFTYRETIAWPDVTRVNYLHVKLRSLRGVQTNHEFLTFQGSSHSVTLNIAGYDHAMLQALAGIVVEHGSPAALGMPPEDFRKMLADRKLTVN